MNKVFDPFLGLFLWVFIDDFGVYSDRASHLTKLELIFQCLDSSKVTLNPKKTTISFSKGKMVGHIVLKDGVATDPKKFNRISKLPFPTMKKALRGFLRMVGYYRRFIHMFATKTRPLSQLYLRECEVETHTPELGLGSPLRLLKLQSWIVKDKTPCIGVFFISLERYESVDVENGLAWAIWTFVAQVRYKRRAGNQTGNLTPDHQKPGIDPIPVCAKGV